MHHPNSFQFTFDFFPENYRLLEAPIRRKFASIAHQILHSSYRESDYFVSLLRILGIEGETINLSFRAPAINVLNNGRNNRFVS